MCASSSKRGSRSHDGHAKPPVRGLVSFSRVARHSIQARRDVLAHLIDRRRPPTRERIEQERGTDMHQSAVVVLLELEEGGIERGQLVCGHVGSWTSRCPSVQPARPLYIAEVSRRHA
jgi:hypothetical protein